jgi:hypothetical protein
MPKKTLLQIITHHRQNPLDFTNWRIFLKLGMNILPLDISRYLYF